MRKLPEPTVSAETSYRTSIDRVKSPDLSHRLLSIVDELVAAANEFEAAARSNTVSSILAAKSVGSVTKDELVDVYNFRFAKLTGPGRHIYDQLLNAAPNGVCPLCGHRDAATLDHFLPKADYPALVVAPLNLLPACWNCNHAKASTAATSEADVTLHPYFDYVDDEKWLFATVIRTEPTSLRFWVGSPEPWDELLTRRVNAHFAAFGLAKLYSAQAANELVNIRHHLEVLYKRAGSTDVAAHLGELEASRRAAHKNSWQTAAYRAWASSAWFCEGGFR